METIFPYFTRTSPRAVKKAYLRAMAKLRSAGRAMYRGRQLVAGPNYSRFLSRRVPDWSKRIRFASWNAGRLSPEIMSETLVWAAQQEMDCLLLQETHWSQTREWMQDGWLCVHTAARKPKQGGVLVCLKETNTLVKTVRWNELVAGRTLRVRAVVKEQQVDILAVYQAVRVAGSTEELEGNLKRRQQVWNALDRCLSSLPTRSATILAT